MRLGYFIIFSLFLMNTGSCASKSVNVLGTYKTKKYSQLGIWLLYLRYDKIYIGNKIELLCDSTFVYETCGNIKKGVFSVTGNRIKLRYKSNYIRYKDSTVFIDDLNAVDQYFIKGNKLVYDTRSQKEKILVEVYKENKIIRDQ